MEKGMLKVWVYVTSSRVPLNEANVYITNSDDSYVIAVRGIDSSGETDVVLIDAPDKELSTSPSEEKPFTSVNVYVQSRGYYNILIRGVQIFAGETSIQEVQMIPLPENYRGNNREIIEITPQDL